jgi:hypothetical protein
MAGLSHHFILFCTSVSLLTINLILGNIYVHELRRQIVLMTVYFMLIAFNMSVKYLPFVSEVHMPKLELHFAFGVVRFFVVLHGGRTASCTLREERVCD